ncbi:MAG: hypothetical protein ACK4TL_16970 [Hyphomicrobiaceae bacterium]
MKPEISRDAARIRGSLMPTSALRSVPALRERLGAAYVVAIIYVLVAAAAFNGYYTKWQMSDFAPPQSLIATLDGTAARPYVFRQLLPQSATAIEKALPQGMRSYVEQRFNDARGALRHPAGADAAKEGYVIRYRIVYYATFLSLFLALFALRSVCLFVGLGQAAATAAPAIFALMIPLLQTRGGYFYDLPEVLAFALAARLALGGHIVPLLLLAAPATLNKEAFFFYCLALPPLLMVRLSLWNAVATALGAAFISGLTYLSIRVAYAANDGQNAILQLVDNLLFYGNPLNLFLFDQTYGLPLFKGYGLVVLGWFTILMVYGWRTVPRHIHQHLMLAALINVPLLLLFCAEGEMRNLSMLYVPVVALIAGALHRWLSTVSSPAVSRPG